MFGDPLGGLLFGGETLDYFRLAIGPKNIDHPAKSGITFSRHESGSVFGHLANMRLRRAGSSRFRLTDRNLRSTAILHLRKPLVRAWLLRVRWYSRRQLALLDLARGGISWFEFIVFRRDIVVGSLFGGHQFLGKAAPKIALRCFFRDRVEPTAGPARSAMPPIATDFLRRRQISRCAKNCHADFSLVP